MLPEYRVPLGPPFHSLLCSQTPGSSSAGPLAFAFLLFYQEHFVPQFPMSFEYALHLRDSTLFLILDLELF